MSIFIDIVLLIVLAICVVIFAKFGFQKIIYRIGKSWISFLVSLVSNKTLTTKFSEWLLLKPITNGINGTLVGIVDNNPSGYNLAQIFEKLPEGFLALLKYFNISLPLLESEYGSATEASGEIIAEISNRIATPLSLTISGILAGIVGFLIPAVATHFYKKKLERVKDKIQETRKELEKALNENERQTAMKIMRRCNRWYTFDKVAGGFIGFVMGVCAMFIVVTVLYIIFQLVIVYNASSSIMAVYEKTFIFKYMNQVDIIGVFKNLFMGLKATI